MTGPEAGTAAGVETTGPAPVDRAFVPNPDLRVWVQVVLASTGMVLGQAPCMPSTHPMTDHPPDPRLPYTGLGPSVVQLRCYAIDPRHMCVSTLAANKHGRAVSGARYATVGTVSVAARRA